MMSTVPIGWAETNLESVAAWASGGTPSRSNDAYFIGDIPWVKTGELGPKFIRDTQEKLSPEAISSSAAKLFPKGSVGIAMYGATIGKLSIWAIDASTNQACAVAQPFPDVLFNEYLYYFLLSQKRKFIEAGKGGAQPNISQGLLRRWPICVPPLREQHRIVAKIEELFSELDKGIENLKLARAQLTSYRQALLKHAFEGRLTADWRAAYAGQRVSCEQLLARIRAEMFESSRRRPLDAKDPLAASSTQERYADWVEIPLSDITVEGLIGIVRSAAQQNQDEHGTRYIKMDRLDMAGHVDMDTDVFVECSVKEVERFSLKKGDILFNTRNSVELVGKTGLVRNAPSAPVVFNNNLMRLRVIPTVVPAFLNFQMCAPDFRNRMEKVKKATTSVAAVYGKDLWSLKVVIPSVTEQKRIVDELDAQLDMVEKLEADIDTNLQRSGALRQSILKKAFEGNLVPQDPNDEPTAALLARIRAERASAATAAEPKGKTRKAGAAKV